MRRTASKFAILATVSALLAGASLLGLSDSAHAAIFIATPPITDPLNVPATAPYGAFSLDFTAVTPDSYRLYTNEPGPGSDMPANQNPVTIETFIESVFGPNLDVFLTGLCSEPNCTGSGTSSAAFSDPDGFNYLALHAGNGEHIFDFINPVTSFSVSGLPQGLSNIRTFAVVPLPGAALLFGSALIGLAWVRRRSAGREPELSAA